MPGAKQKKQYVLSLRLKIVAIVFSFLAVFSLGFFIYSVTTTSNYRQLRMQAVEKTVEFESEQVNKTIREMQQNAIDLANAGRDFYFHGSHEPQQGQDIVIQNFTGFPASVGGGIWYEPYSLMAGEKRVCYYACFDPGLGRVRYDEGFITDTYDYHTQSWYLEISASANEAYNTVWTSPYYDDAGTFALMTTVGAGIYNEMGQFVGMSTVDWEIQSVVNNLSAIAPTQNSFVLLASLRDDYILSNTYDNTSSETGGSLEHISWFSELSLPEGGQVGISTVMVNGAEYTAFSRSMDNGWLLSVQIPAGELFAEVEKSNQVFSVVLVIATFVMLGFAYYLVQVLINRPIQTLTKEVSELGKGDLNKQIVLKSRDELGLLADTFNRMTRELKASVEESARERAEKERIGAELDVATTIQASLLPCIFPAFPSRNDFDVYARMLPAREVGGDFYDFFLIDDDHLAVVIADVSGKGVPAALFMVIAKTLIKNNAQYGIQPHAAFETVNDLLCENNDAGMFVTAFMGYLELSTGRFTYVNAGHNPPLIRSKTGDFKQLPTRPGFVLAGMEGISYVQQECTLACGDVLFLYTDGITEAMNPEQELFGEARFEAAANRCKNMPPKSVLEGVLHTIQAFAKDAEQADDITALLLAYNGGNSMTELKLPAKAENLPQVLDFVEKALEECNCAPKFKMQIPLAVEELFINIAQHAYAPKAGDVTIRMQAGQEICIEFEDAGKAFNPLLAPEPDISASAEEREIGGLGIFMVKEIMDSIEYRRDGHKNILIIRVSA